MAPVLAALASVALESAVAAAVERIAAALTGERSCVLDIRNNTDQPLEKVTEHLEHGGWDVPPLSDIPPRHALIFGARSTGVGTGTEGSITYGGEGVTMTAAWNNPFVGSNDSGMRIAGTNKVLYRANDVTGSGNTGAHMLYEFRVRPAPQPIPAGAPVAMAHQDESLLVGMAVSSTGVLNVAWVDGAGDWVGPYPIGGAVFPPGASVALVKQDDNLLTALAVDNDGRLRAAWVDGRGSWHGPDAFGEPVFPPGAPVAMFKQDDELLTALAVDTDGRLRAAWVERRDGWHGPDAFGEPVFPPGAPVALFKQDDELLTALAVDRDGRLRAAWVERRDGWHGPDAFGEPVFRRGTPVALFKQDDELLTALAVDTDGRLRAAWVERRDGWHGPDAFGEPVFSPGAPVALFKQDHDLLTALAVDRDGRMRVAWVERRDGWHGPEPISADVFPPNAGVAMFVQTFGLLRALAVGKDRRMYVTWVEGRGGWHPAEPISPPPATPQERQAQAQALVAQALQLWNQPAPAPAQAAGQIAEALTILRELAAADPAYLPALAELLVSPGTDFLGGIGGVDEAIALGAEAAGIYQQLTQTDPRHRQGWGRALLSQGRWLWQKGDKDQAIARAQDAVAQAREAVVTDPGFAGTLGDWLVAPTAAYLAQSGRRAEAVQSLGEAVDIFAKLGDEPRLAAASQQLAALGVFVGRWTMVQDNGYTVSLALNPADGGGGFGGTAEYPGMPGQLEGGRLTEPDVVFEIRWSDGHVGRYIGRLGDDLRWTGDSVQVGHPENRARWTAQPSPSA